MRRAALAADERDRLVPADLEEWDRPMLYGHAEAELALVG